VPYSGHSRPSREGRWLPENDGADDSFRSPRSRILSCHYHSGRRQDLPSSSVPPWLSTLGEHQTELGIRDHHLIRAVSRFGTSLYYAVTVAQEVLLLSPLATAVRFVPMGCLGKSPSTHCSDTWLRSFLVGFCVTMALAVLFNWLSIKTLVVGGLTISVVANVSSAVAEPGDSFWSVSIRRQLGLASVLTSFDTSRSPASSSHSWSPLLAPSCTMSSP